MKDCKCGMMPPCYGSLERAIYEEAKKVNDEWEKSRARHSKIIGKLRNKLMEGGFLDDTHDKVYELNKQMCDIDKHLSEAGYFRMICDGQIETRKKLIDMEEKKTKKMTKAEAFEWLKGKKVRVFKKTKEVQEKLFSIGYKWCDGSTEVVTMCSVDFLIIDDDTFQYTHLIEHFKKLAYQEISADDILSIEIVEEEKVLSVDCALEHAKWIMKYLREKCSPHTKMIIEGDHAELVEGIKSVVWKEDME